MTEKLLELSTKELLDQARERRDNCSKWKRDLEDDILSKLNTDRQTLQEVMPSIKNLIALEQLMGTNSEEIYWYGKLRMRELHEEHVSARGKCL